MKSGISSFLSLLLLFSLLALAACKKKNQSQLPKILILSPVENARFEWSDTLNVSLDLSAEESLQKVEVKLLDQNQISVLSPQVQNLSGNRWQGTILLLLNRKITASGTYSIQVACTDVNNNRATAFRDIQISVTAPQALGAFFLTTTSVNTYRAKKIMFNQSQEENYDSKSGLAQTIVYQVNHRQAYYLGNGNSSIYSIDYSNNTQNTFASSVAALPFTFHTIFAGQDFFYASHYQGKIQSFQKDGSVFKNYEYQPNQYYPTVFALSTTHLLALEIPISGGNNKLVTFDKETGIGLQELETTEQISKIIFDGLDFYLSSSNGSSSKIFRYKVNTNVLEPVINLTTPIIDLNFSEPQRLLYVTAAGIKEYQTTTMIMANLINKSGLSQIEIDRETQTLFVLNKDNAQLERYQLFSGNFTGNYPAPLAACFALLKI